MGFFKDRSDYLKLIATSNKLIGHGQFVNGISGDKRKSYFRLNKEEELAAACANWAHFPCMVHFGFAASYSDNPEVQMLRRNILNDILLLDKASSDTDMNIIETAKDNAFTAAEQVLSYIRNDLEENGDCSPFADIDFSTISITEFGPVNATLYGFRIMFRDITFPDGIINYDATKWNE